MRKKRKGMVGILSYLPKGVPMDLQWELIDTARKLSCIRKKIRVELRWSRRTSRGEAWGLNASIYISHDLEESLDTILHEFSHIKDEIDERFIHRKMKLHHDDRIWEKRAKRVALSLRNDELSDRRTGYRNRCREILSMISEVMK